MTKPTAIIGNGWAALGAAGLLAAEGKPVCWIEGTGGRLLSPVSSLETVFGMKGAETWKRLFERFGVECGEFQAGSYLREFRNKGFRQAPWTDVDSRNGALWIAEHRMAPVAEGRFARPLSELEEELRSKLDPEKFPSLKIIRGVPVVGFRVENGQTSAVILGSGQEIACERAIYADRWTEISKLTGLPKSVGFVRRREPVGVLQAVFFHKSPMGVGLLENFYGALHREPGEEIERHVWGYFSADGTQSLWSTCLGAEEGEDNHEIGKRLRRMKSALDKMFAGAAWLPSGCTAFTQNVRDEQVRFEEAILFAQGDDPQLSSDPVTIPGVAGLSFLTDGYGPSSAMAQASSA